MGIEQASLKELRQGRARLKRRSERKRLIKQIRLGTPSRKGRVISSIFEPRRGLRRGSLTGSLTFGASLKATKLKRSSVKSIKINPRRTSIADIERTIRL